MARMTYTALQRQIRVLTINTDRWEATPRGGHKSKHTNRGGIAYQAKSRYAIHYRSTTRSMAQ